MNARIRFVVLASAAAALGAGLQGCSQRSEAAITAVQTTPATGATATAAVPTAAMPKTMMSATGVHPAGTSGPGPAGPGTGSILGVPRPAAEYPDGDEYSVVNPTSGAVLAVTVTAPEAGTGALPALVLVPGGSGDSSAFGPGTGTDAAEIAAGGFVVVTFDPDGRGRSAGTEDFNGTVHQDGLAAVVEFTATLDGVDETRIGLVTFSYGVTMAAGALARHAEMPVGFLLDWEGPADRDDTAGCDGGGSGHLGAVAACDNAAFWAQREATTFLGTVDVVYARLQSEDDHVQPDAASAVELVNAAVLGGAPTVLLNGAEVATPLASADTLLSNRTDIHLAMVVAEQAAMLFGLAA